MKQTAVEWAINEIRNNWYDYEYGDADMDDLIKKVKEIEREQMKYFIQVGYYAHSQGHKKDEELYNYWIDNFNK